MKNRLLISVLVLSLFSLSGMAQEKKKTVDLTFKTSITCDGCINTILSSLPLEKGVKNVTCDLDTKEVKVTIKEGKTDAEKIKRSIEKLGYTAVESKASKDESLKKKKE